MSPKAGSLPDLEPRFLPPPGWRSHNFKRGDYKIHFGTVSPPGSVPDVIYVCLEGLSEFSEKYFEIANEAIAQNRGMWIMDWRGQGRSDRYFKNSEKRHSYGMDQDVEDLNYFIREYVLPAAVHPDRGRIPLVMLAHSMGANIGMRYLSKYPGVFAAAAMTNPMIGIMAIKWIPSFLRKPVTWMFNEIADASYAFGAGDWKPDERKDSGRTIFSSDPVRDAVHNAWFMFDKKLIIGFITFRWLYEAYKSCLHLMRKDVLEGINIPCLIAISGDDRIIDGEQTKQIARLIPQANLVEFPGAKHELLMEKDEYRAPFFKALDSMLADHKISQQLKPF